MDPVYQHDAGGRDINIQPRAVPGIPDQSPADLEYFLDPNQINDSFSGFPLRKPAMLQVFALESTTLITYCQEREKMLCVNQI